MIAEVIEKLKVKNTSHNNKIIEFARRIHSMIKNIIKRRNQFNITISIYKILQNHFPNICFWVLYDDITQCLAIYSFGIDQTIILFYFLLTFSTGKIITKRKGEYKQLVKKYFT